MRIPELDRFSLHSTAEFLKVSDNILEDYLRTGQLKASFMCTGSVLFSKVHLEGLGEMEWFVTSSEEPEPAEVGIYEIQSYGKICWENSTSNPTRNVNLIDFDIYLTKDKMTFSIASALTINKDDLFIIREELARFTPCVDSGTVPVDTESVVNLSAKEEAIRSKPIKKERPSQLDRTGKTSTLGTLLIEALKDYREVEGKPSKTFRGLFQFMKQRMDDVENVPEYLSVITRIGTSEKKFLLLKGKKCNKWQSLANLERDYRTRKFKLYPPDNILP